jgi:hypothetical protein
MKNIIEPHIIESFKVNRPSYQEIKDFLESHSNVSASYLSKLIGFSLQGFYDWKNRQKKKETLKPDNTANGFSVSPRSGNDKYPASEKLALVREYVKLQNGSKSEFLRKYGLYQSDIGKWSEVADLAAIEALSQRRTRSDKKSESFIELESLKKEIAGQEKTIAKLAALVVIQKKVSEILAGPNTK